MSIVGQIVLDAHGVCEDCGYGTALDDDGVPFRVHAANCPRVDRDATAYVACRLRSCRRVLDPRRVRVYGATACNEKHRVAAWKIENNYGAHPGARNGGRPRASGLQISWGKAVDELARALGAQRGLPHDDAYMQRMARNILRPALSVRQRAMLDQRERSGERGRD